MRAVLQRVTQARVTVDGETVGAITTGLLVLLGVEAGDVQADADYIASKIADLRLFDAEGDSGEQSVVQIGGAVLLVSQFTLLGDCRKGRRPSWAGAARPETAIQWYEAVQGNLARRGIPVQTGIFRAAMQVTSTNEGPLTVLLDSKKVF